MADLQRLVKSLENTLSPDKSVRKEAEDFLRSLESQQGYSQVLLQITDSGEVPAHIRQASAIAFKNLLKRHWRILDETATPVISTQDRDYVKSVIVQLMLKTPDAVQKQLSDAISIIGLEDFPKKWPGLLEEMVKYFQTSDFHLINGVLQTAHSLFRRYRHECRSEELWREIALVLETLASPLTSLFISTMKLSAEHAQNQEALKVLFNSLLLIVKVYYSLIVQELPDQFADENIKPWMENLLVILNTSNKLLETDDDEEPGLLEQTKAEICALLSLFAQKYDTDFAPFLPNFVQSVWTLLVTVDSRVKYDNLVSNAIEFLASVAEKPVYKDLFTSEETLQSICEKVVVPNMQFREADEELFVDNPEEYMRRDLEGSDIGTRRRAACTLVQALCRSFESPITAIFARYIDSLLVEFSKDPKANWKAKSIVLYLIPALATRTKTAKHGATKTSDFVNIADIFSSQCLPLLQNPDLTLFPVLRADCMRYITTFRSILPQDVLVSCIPLLVHHTVSPTYILHTYAAHCLEKILTVRSEGNLVVTSAALQPYYQQLINNLFQTLQLDCSLWNEYVMKAIMRVMSTMKDELPLIYNAVLQELNKKLVAVCQNPSRPHFNHYLFESISCVIRHTCLKNPGLVENVELLVLPILQDILLKDIVEFMPYAFQILSLLIELRPPPVSDMYMSIYPTLLTPLLWEQQGNIPALVRLLQAFIQKAPQDLCKGDKLSNLLGVFQKLIASKNNDHEGFYLLNSLIEYGDQKAMENFWKDIFIVLFQRFQSSKTTKYVKGLIVCFCLFAGKFGGNSLLQIIDSIQPNLFAMVLEKIVIPDMQKVSGPTERKIGAVGVTKILTETPPMLVEPYVKFWSPLLRSLVSLFELPEDDSVPDDEHFIEIEDTPGYQTAFSQLAFVGSRDKDPFGTEVSDPKVHLAHSLHKLSSQHPGKLSALISSGLDQDAIKYLQSYLQAANVATLL
jgi:exportin-2 (importin alpha re-exporter)